MEKVYAVIEEYEDTGDYSYETDMHLFSTLEKAKEYFKKVVEREKQDSWIANKPDCWLEEDELSFNAFVEDCYNTTIWIQDKEIL